MKSRFPNRCRDLRSEDLYRDRMHSFDVVRENYVCSSALSNDAPEDVTLRQCGGEAFSPRRAAALRVAMWWLRLRGQIWDGHEPSNVYWRFASI
jgi:hypothetical protein